jgi:hypothetical protein
MTRLNQARELQSRDGFAHHIATDTKLRAELLLGWQTLTGREAFIEDACAQLLRNLVWEIFRATQTIKR